jgi:putative chitinase
VEPLKIFSNDLADDYARQPVKIGSRVYANRMGNGE